MRVLITGAEGLLGTALMGTETTHTLIPAARADADLRDLDSVIKLVSDAKPDALIHTAALVGGIGGNQMRSGQYFFENTQINLNVLEAARRLGVNDVTSFMSTCVFPDDASYPLTTDQLHIGPPHESNFGYAYSKRMLEVQARSYNVQWGTRFKILVPANMYGPGDNFSLSEGHVVPALIHKAILSKARGQDLEIWGSGKPLREFLYSKDVARVVLSLIGHDHPSPLIVTNGIERSIKDLVLLVVEASGFEGNVRFDTSKPEGQFRKPSSAEEFEKVLPDFSFTSLEEGIRETWRWFENRYPLVRM